MQRFFEQNGWIEHHADSDEEQHGKSVTQW